VVFTPRRFSPRLAGAHLVGTRAWLRRNAPRPIQREGSLRALVFYASTHGHTAKIASRVAEAVRQADIGVDILDARHDTAPEPSGYDGTILAAS